MDTTSGQGGGAEDQELEELMVKSFIQIMMETEKTAEGKAELAQAQENDRKRRETQQMLQFQLGGDTVNIQGLQQPPPPPQQQLQPQQPYQQQANLGNLVPQPHPQVLNQYNQHHHQQQQPYNTPPQYQHAPPQPPPPPQQNSYPTRQAPIHDPYLVPQHQTQPQPQPQPQQLQPNEHLTPQANDTYYQYQLQQQQLQQHYQQQLSQLQQRQQELQHQYQASRNNQPAPPSNNNSATSVPNTYPQSAVTVNPAPSNDNSVSTNSGSLSQILHHIVSEHHNPSSNIILEHSNYDNGSNFSQNPQHIDPSYNTMTNTVSTLSNNDVGSIDVYAHSGDVYANPDYISSNAGPLGMPIMDKNDGNGPKIVSLDESDNDVEERPNILKNDAGSSNYNKDVYPLSPKAVERDMFKQEYVPQPKSTKNNDMNTNEHQNIMSSNESIDQYQTTNGDTNANGFMGESIDPTAFGYPDIISNPDVLFSQPSDTEDDQQESVPKYEFASKSSSSPRRQQQQLSYQELLQQKLQLQNELYVRQKNESQRLLNKPYSRAGRNDSNAPDNTEPFEDIDLDRYTHVPSQLTSIMEDTSIPMDSYRENLASSMDTYRTIDPDPFGNDQDISLDFENKGNKLYDLNSNNPNNPKGENNKNKFTKHNKHLNNSNNTTKNNKKLLNQRYPPSSTTPSIKIHGVTSPSPAFKVQGPGYKVNVSGENIIQKRATRANILSRAEQLLDARRVQPTTDKSDSSDGNLSQTKHDDGYDEEDDDNIQELRGPRHRALKHVKHQYYDDNTSYNSSDDILNTLRFSRQGPLTKAARRARLTSFNARLHKQRRVKASMRLVSAFS